MEGYTEERDKQTNSRTRARANTQAMTTRKHIQNSIEILGFPMQNRRERKKANTIQVVIFLYAETGVTIRKSFLFCTIILRRTNQ